MRKIRILNLLWAGVLLLLMVGCGEKKELWQILEENQYNRYKPNLDHMVEKYGDMFEMDVHGQITCTDPEYKGWGIASRGGVDNFAIRLRRDDIEQFIKEIAEPIFGECKVYAVGGVSSSLDVDADTEEFFSYKRGLVHCVIYVLYSEDCKAQGKAFVDAFSEKGYKLAPLDVVYVDKERYEQVDRSDINPGMSPEDYQFRMVVWFYDGDEEYMFRWKEEEE